MGRGDGNNLYKGTNRFYDSGFQVVDNADNTKVLAIQCSGITAATTRTITVPDASITLRSNSASIQAAGNTTLTVAQSGEVFIGTEAGVQTYTLPIATTAGLRYTFVAGNAGGEVLVTPNAADSIKCKATVDQGASVAPVAGTGIKNTAATNVLGDNITLVSDGVSAWYMVAQSGIWASQ